MDIKKQIVIASLALTTAVLGGCDLSENNIMEKLEILTKAAATAATETALKESNKEKEKTSSKWKWTAKEAGIPKDAKAAKTAITAAETAIIAAATAAKAATTATTAAETVTKAATTKTTAADTEEANKQGASTTAFKKQLTQRIEIEPKKEGERSIYNQSLLLPFGKDSKRSW
ncbi:MAG: hypothetical protein EU981_02855 [Candidatus Liberibacter ctenarytainae]|uniref:Lipoprotein n=1 Tax=Candidatus Liberibacter ctenarytainae TaxID=2020335 RepID=A0A937DLX3_9HYPH|nr:hypothetical protein [Candidatus Liberibacter ctenarytainae]